jgi:Protein of unknown function (DUF2877)
MLGRLTGAGSDALLDLVTGAPRSATVVGAGPHATYLLLDARHGDADGPGAPAELVALVSRRAIRVPCAIVLARDGAALPGLVPGARAGVGDGEVRWDGGSLAVVRWWRAASVNGASPARPDRAGLARRVAAARLLVGGHLLPADVPQALTSAVVAIDRRDAAAAAEALEPVLGLGSGLTPSADDAIAGLLLAARCWHGPERASTVSAVGEQLGPHLVTRTTAVSAGLLRHAAEGRGAPEVVRAVEHLTGRHVDADGRDVLGRLVSLGHSSGRDTALGILAFLERQTLPRPTAASPPTYPYAHRPTARESA